jgi:hypothetical protein
MPTMNVREPRSASGWILLAGFALASLGLVAESKQQDVPPPVRTQVLPMTPGSATADSNDRMIAVTGVDVTGGSLLYIIDTENRQLAVYQAQGGTKSTMKLEWVGGRNIDLDLRVDGFNDKSQFSYKDLESKFTPDDADISDE